MFAKNPLRAESAGQRVEIMPVFCLGLSGLGKFVPRVTWASTRHARSSPGCHIAGFQPAFWGHSCPQFKELGLAPTLNHTPSGMVRDFDACKRRFRLPLQPCSAPPEQHVNFLIA